MLWISESSQHTLYLAPGSFYDPKAIVNWVNNTDFNNLVGQTRDVFFSCNQDRNKAVEVHYAGTYLCRQIGELETSEYHELTKGVSTIHDLKIRDAENLGCIV